MKIKIAVFVFFVFAVNFALTQVPLNGRSCPTFENCTRKNVTFNASMVSGIYYLHTAVGYFFHKGYKCSYYNYTQPKPNWLHFVKHDFDEALNTERITEADMELKPDGRLLANYTELKIPFVFKVIDITPDYFIFASCDECGFLNNKDAGIHFFAITKLASPSCEESDRIKQKFAECGIPRQYIHEQNQDDCDHCSYL